MRSFNDLDWKRLEKEFKKSPYYDDCDGCRYDCDKCTSYQNQSWDMPLEKINPTVIEALLSLKKQVDELRKMLHDKKHE